MFFMRLHLVVNLNISYAPVWHTRCSHLHSCRETAEEQCFLTVSVTLQYELLCAGGLEAVTSSRRMDT